MAIEKLYISCEKAGNILEALGSEEWTKDRRSSEPIAVECTNAAFSSSVGIVLPVPVPTVLYEGLQVSCTGTAAYSTVL